MNQDFIQIRKGKCCKCSNNIELEIHYQYQLDIQLAYCFSCSKHTTKIKSLARV